MIILEKFNLSNRISQLQVMLFEYEIIYVTRKVVKGHAIVGQQAENAMEGYELLDFKFLDEDIMEIDEVESQERDVWQMYFNGVVNHFGKRIRVVLLSLNGNQFPVAIKLYFQCINNITEYEACVNKLLLTMNIKVKKLKVYGDLALIIYQVNRK